MDIVERVARALAANLGRQDYGNPFELTAELKLEYIDQGETDFAELARASLAAMLEAVGEPVAWMYDCDGDVWAAPITPEPTVDDDWTETPLYSLAALKEEL